MKRKKGIFALLLSAVLTFSTVGLSSFNAFAAENVLSKGAWFETMYIEWTGSSQYNVYYKESTSENYIKVDDELVRNVEGSKYRVDVLGLKGDTSYDVKVVPVNNGTEGDAVITYTDTPMPYDRSGFAFDGSNDAPGAYNMDGTVADGALIVYVTNENKSNVYKNKNIKNILSGLNSLNSGKPVIVRFIGKVDPLSSSDLNPGMWNNTCGVTIEGVGPGAGLNGWGIGSGKNKDTEFRNLNFSDYVEDAIGFEQAEKLWVHNNTFYSGYNPKDSTAERDKLHGDGSCDLRTCNKVTVSYNHFSGTDKTSLIGSSSTSRESTGNITFHHNFFDKTNQRTPRVRWHNIHAYNNYYYGTVSYGIGATCNCSIFAENNYFEDAQSPFVTSSQGGYGTFSDNEGGVIKAYNNTMVNTRMSEPGVDYFDSPSREYRLTGADYTAKKGGWTYNNFDANGYIGSNNYILHSPNEAKNIVLSYGGSIKTASIKSDNVVTPPTVTGNVTAVYYYDSAESGSTGNEYGGIDGTGTFFSGTGTCKSGTASGYRGTEKYNYSGCFTASTINFTTSSAAKLTVIASTKGNTPQRFEVTNPSNPSAVYHGTIQTGNKGNDVLSEVSLLEAGTYSIKLNSNIDIYYIEVAEYDGEEPTTVSTESTSTESTTETTTVSATESTETTTVSTPSVPNGKDSWKAIDYDNIVQDVAISGGTVMFDGDRLNLVAGEGGIVGVEDWKLDLTTGQNVLANKAIKDTSTDGSGRVTGLDASAFGGSANAKVRVALVATAKVDGTLTCELKLNADKEAVIFDQNKNVVYYYKATDTLDPLKIEIPVEAGKKYSIGAIGSSPWIYSVAVNNGEEESTTETTTESTTESTESTTESATDTPEPPTPSYLYGDVNGNGMVTSEDIAVLIQHLLNGAKLGLDEITDDYMNYIDVDKDGKLTSADAAHILQKVLDDNYKMPVEA